MCHVGCAPNVGLFPARPDFDLWQARRVGGSVVATVAAPDASMQRFLTLQPGGPRHVAIPPSHFRHSPSAFPHSIFFLLKFYKSPFRARPPHAGTFLLRSCRPTSLHRETGDASAMWPQLIPWQDFGPLCHPRVRVVHREALGPVPNPAVPADCRPPTPFPFVPGFAPGEA